MSARNPSPAARPTVRPTPENPAERIRAEYQELRRMSAQRLRRQQPHPTLQTTELVHEAYIRLAKNGPENYLSRKHFFGAAARVMRETLLDRTRRRRAIKRGRDWRRVPLEELAPVGVPVQNFHDLHAALKRLDAFDPVLRQIIELRFFIGLSTAEVATIIQRGQSTVRRDLAIAKAWLQRELQAGATVAAI